MKGIVYCFIAVNGLAKEDTLGPEFHFSSMWPS